MLARKQLGNKLPIHWHGRIVPNIIECIILL
jgi:hypothetical protein